MADPIYTRNDLKEIHADLKGDIKEVYGEVQKTNGKVQNLEKWRAFMTGGMAVLSMLLVPTLLYVVRIWLNG